MAGNGTMRYHFASLDTLGGSLGAEVKHLDELSQNLKSQVAALGDHWQSQQAKAAYDEAQQHWDQVYQQAIEHLAGIHRGVNNAHDTMRDAEHMITRSFNA